MPIDQSKYEQLKEVIKKANPEIMELKFGSTVIQNKELIDWAKETKFIAYDKKTGRAWYQENDGSIFVKKNGLKDIKILGRPIRLVDVLFKLSIKVFGKYKSISILAAKPLLDIVMDWNLKDDNLDHQSEKCKEFLINLLVP